MFSDLPIQQLYGCLRQGKKKEIHFTIWFSFEWEKTMKKCCWLFIWEYLLIKGERWKEKTHVNRHRYLITAFSLFFFPFAVYSFTCISFIFTEDSSASKFQCYAYRKLHVLMWAKKNMFWWIIDWICPCLNVTFHRKNSNANIVAVKLIGLCLTLLVFKSG